MHSPKVNLSIRFHHLAPLFAQGSLEVVPTSVSSVLDSWLNEQPWKGQRLDLGKLPAARVVSANAGALHNEVEHTKIGSRSWAIAFFSRDEMCVGARLVTLIETLDVVYWRAPGCRYVFSAEKVAGGWVPLLDCVMEYDGGDIVSIIDFSK